MAGVRISELNKYDIGGLNQTDSMLLPISYNGSTKVISIADVISLFNNNDQDAAQNAGIAENQEAISYLASVLKQMAFNQEAAIRDLEATHATINDIQTSSITTNSANIAAEHMLNDAQQKQINELEAKLIGISATINTSYETNNVNTELIVNNATKINNVMQTNEQQNISIAYNTATIESMKAKDDVQDAKLTILQQTINNIEETEVWGVYTD